MKAWMLLVLLAASALALAGCAGAPTAPSGAAPPPYAPPSSQPSAPGAGAPGEINPVPLPPSAAQPPAAAPADCGSLSGDAYSQCRTQEAINSQNVTYCVSIADQDGRFKCVTAWCLSPARDYHQCGNLTNYDDRLACLNKCNPNPNT
ncbi:MAG: hypothetical protein KGH63_01790 [Candidatus Micrarchaeota archaeon]|nr:hypothetical protein [Candidatus Micrarchaeota archaeon]